MPDSSNSIQTQLANLRQGFIDQLPSRVAKIKAAHVEWSAELQPTTLAEYYRLVHSLTGAGATFGCEQMSQVARQLERLLKQIQEKESATQGDIEAAAALLDNVSAEAVTAVGSKDSASEEEQLSSEKEELLVPDMRQIYILGSDPGCGKGTLKAQLEHFGYKVTLIGSELRLVEAVTKQRPAIILANVDLVGDSRAGIEAVRQVQQQQSMPIPVVFFASQADFISRLEAVRVNGVAYLSKPLGIEKLIGVIDRQLAAQKSDPYRVLIVADQEDQAERNALVLRQADVAVEIVTDTAKLFDALSGFRPEFVLVDVYLPNCNGYEVAEVISQQMEFVGMPIVFLSCDGDDKDLADFSRLKGRDVLSAPLEPSVMVDLVRARADNYRSLQAMMNRDSLTGLLNHTQIMEILEHELSRAERYGAIVSFAILDLDKFKRINDTYGHAVGDRVIKSFSRLLQQRLRRADIYGRYGGEEFAIIMPETSIDAALLAMNDVRSLFYQVVHHAGDESFSVTLSCGVSSSSETKNATELCDFADQRLKQAKDNGRNQVIGRPSLTKPAK